MDIGFSKRLTEERERIGCKADDFAKLGGVGKTTQYNYEKGLRKPDIEYLYRISKMGCDIFYVITGKRDENIISPDEMEFLSIYRSASQELKRALKEMLKIDL